MWVKVTTLAAACPECNKHFTIELEGSSMFAVAACDYCGYQKGVNTFVKELKKQQMAPIKRQQKIKKEEERHQAKLRKDKLVK